MASPSVLPWRGWLAVCVAGAFVLAAGSCGGGDNPWEGTEVVDREGLVAIVANSNLHRGENRVVIGLIRAGAPLLDARASITFFDLDNGARRGDSGPLEYVAIEGVERGYYTTTASFVTAGLWGAEVVVDGVAGVARARFGVAERSPVPVPGDPAPPSETRTLTDTELAALTTDPDPDPRLYQLSVAQAVRSGRPSVIAFATPALCQTQTCGPALEVVKGMLPEYGGRVAFVHVEVYENLDTPNPTVVPALREWNLRTEPWVFVVDSHGVVAAAFEGVLGERELRAAIEKVLS
jgi:hypothetical protein